jgi:DeoR/GlpR family transcriptional regulator of sugar metabolism
MKNVRLKPEKRRKMILELVGEKDIVEVSELMHIFHISRPTITRDLNILKDKGYITKTYGAVIDNQMSLPRSQVYSFDISLHQQIEEKKAIARLALSCIKNNTSVVFNSGVTTYEIAKLVAKSNLNINIITNSLEISKVFMDDVLRNVLLLGGDLAPGGHKVTGKLTCANMNDMHGDIAFIGIHDIDLELGMTMPFSAEAELISIMVKRCRKKILIADNTKFGRVSLYKVDCSFNDFNTIITDKHVERSYAEAFEKMGIEVMIAIDFH